MDTSRSRHTSSQGQNRRARLWMFLLLLMGLSVVGFTAFLLVMSLAVHGHNGPPPHSTPSPVVVVSPTPTSTPSPTPSPGVLGYPLYSGNPHRPEIVLTFDDGPSPASTAQILAILERYEVQATFFVIGSQAAAYPGLVRKEAQLGNIVGNHTWTHPNLTTLPPAEIRAQLQSTSREIQADAGVAPTVFRPPGGHFTSSVQSIAASLGLSTILWNVDPRDWSRPGMSAIIQNVLTSTHNGSIILLHDGGGDRSQTVAALPTILATLVHRGFQFVTLPRLIQDLPPGGTGSSQIVPDQLSPEGTFNPSLTFPRSPSLKEVRTPNGRIVSPFWRSS